jgi:RNA polymerase sigma-70 factor (ECF subfamily)
LNVLDEDYVLMQRIAQKDRDAYGILLNKYLGVCVRFAERMLGNRQDAEDLAQDIYLKLWLNPTSWKQQSSFSTWLYRVTFNSCIDYKRKTVFSSNIELELLKDNAEGADEVMIEHQKSAYIQNLLQKLPDRQRAALILSYYEGLNNQQSAEMLGISLLALQQLLFRARQNLKILLMGNNREFINE